VGAEVVLPPLALLVQGVRAEQVATPTSKVPLKVIVWAVAAETGATVQQVQAEAEQYHFQGTESLEAVGVLVE